MRVGLLSLMVLAAGCGTTGPDFDPLTLEGNRALWRSHDLVDYALVARVTCYCAIPRRGWHRVAVEGGEVVRVEHLEGFGVIPSEEIQYWDTVEDLFDLIAMAEQDPEDRITADVIYDNELGFPRRIDYLVGPRGGDGYVLIEVDEVRPQAQTRD